MLPIMIMNAPPATIQWRALFWIFVASMLAIVKPLAAGAYSAASRSPMAS